MSVVVRPATPDDLDALVTLLGELHDPPTATANADVMDKIVSQQGRTLLIAVEDGAPVGTADLQILPNLTHDAAPVAFVQNVVVTSGRRRQGIGRTLMEEIARRAVSAGCYKIEFLSANHRTVAHLFYDSLGYERWAEGFRRYLL